MFEQASSIEEWISLARRYSHAAHALLKTPQTRNLAWSNAGFALECILKAAIMAKEGVNRFPDRPDRKELYVHDIEALARVLGVSITADDEIAAYWSVVVRWRREHTYVSGEMPEAVVRELVEAVFSDEGVVPWLCRSYLRNFLPPERNIWRN